jgi:hypothetical protein
MKEDNKFFIKLRKPSFGMGFRNLSLFSEYQLELGYQLFFGIISNEGLFQ